MRIYIANDGYTLRKIANQHQIPVTELMALNPNIEKPDQNISGKPVRLPSLNVAGMSRLYIPPTCPPAPPTDYLDQWIPLTPIEEMEKTDYDVLIIGTGAGGSAVLWRLCEQLGASGKRIGIIEAGDLLLPMHAQNLPTLNVKRYVQLFTNPKISIPIGKGIPDFPAATLFYALGGRTLFWSGVSPRMHPSVLSKWPLTLKEMNYYYNIAEEVMNVSREYTKGSSITEVLVNRLRGGGFNEAAGFPLAVDLAQTKYGRIHSNVFFSAMNLFAYSLNRRSFDLAVNARAVKVLHENGKAVGVEVKNPDKKSFFLKSRNVVFSAGALDTPQILLHSGIQGRAIGHYLTNHSFIMAHGVLDRADFSELLGTLGILIPQTNDQPFQIQLYGPGDNFWYSYEEPPLQKELEVRFEGFGIVESRFENQVYLNPNIRDEYGVPKIQIDFSYSEKDKEIIDQVAQAVKQVSEVIKAPLISENGKSDLCLMPPGQDNHASGTCRMSDDSRDGATNRYGEVFGVAGLFVADNSVLPPLGASNPTLSTIALAIRTADYIIKKL
ncbi:MULTISPECIES: GMC oxidoreductase [unclassified Paenibacillus]|uniref:GMC oxidoreductase n=1 Tax=unclassified Paenibacillus TaxID=185978 RepID=UPI00277DB2FE|nr:MULTISPECIES: GMC family oxidoreductase [unclassified Paenibacillus]MDQ0903583.1 choline dehydrogenase-like flavoprotein [Paenibacillus sp. V4I7]MDQ0917939.1 choline dehydrogenase-like flavoprotein [Paenibacillus sp. V4I5]